MAVTRRPRSVGSLQDLQQLFSPLDPQETKPKETEIMNNAQNASTTNNVNASPADMAEALQMIQATRQALNEQVARAAATAQASEEQAADAVKRVSEMRTDFESATSDLKARINVLEAAAKAANGGTAPVKKPVYKRALDIAQQVGGVGALIGGMVYGGKLAYDRITGDGEATQA